jgi:ribose 1,5-bisphosphokinase
MVVHISAAHEVLAQRLAQRGRESGDEMVKRLSRNVALNLPAHAVSIDNNSTVEDAVSSLTHALKIHMQRA